MSALNWLSSLCGAAKPVFPPASEAESFDADSPEAADVDALDVFLVFASGQIRWGGDASAAVKVICSGG